jgi:hypothetical protein
VLSYTIHSIAAVGITSESDNGTPSLRCTLPPDAQTILIEAAPARFFRPP